MAINSQLAKSKCNKYQCHVLLINENINNEANNVAAIHVVYNDWLANGEISCLANNGCIMQLASINESCRQQ
jgi:hypothetical protein